MTTVCSYRLYCDECTREVVVRESLLDDHPWKVKSLGQHAGLCPACNDAVDASESDFDDRNIEVEFTECRGIGAGTASNLREAGYVTRGDVRDASDDELRDVTGVGSTSLSSLRDTV